MFRVDSVTVLATTLNVVGAVEEEKDTAPELFLPPRVPFGAILRRRPTCSLLDLEFGAIFRRRPTCSLLDLEFENR